MARLIQFLGREVLAVLASNPGAALRLTLFATILHDGGAR